MSKFRTIIIVLVAIGISAAIFISTAIGVFAIWSWNKHFNKSVNKKELAYLDEGNHSQEAGQYEKAITQYSNALKINPTNVEALNNRSIAYMYLDKYDEAIQDASAAIAINPKETAGYVNRGYSLLQQQKYDAAINDFTTIIGLIPSPDFEIYVYRGTAYFALENYPLAINDFTKAIELFPNNDDALMRRGDAYYAIKEYDKSITDYTQAIKIDVNNVVPYGFRAISYTEVKKFDLAIGDYVRGIQLSPDNQMYFLSMLEIFLITDQYDKFLEWQNKMFAAIADDKQTPENKIIALFLSDLYAIAKNQPTEKIEQQLNELLKTKTELNWDFKLTDEWSADPKTNLTLEQRNKIKTLTDNVKATTISTSTKS